MKFKPFIIMIVSLTFLLVGCAGNYDDDINSVAKADEKVTKEYKQVDDDVKVKVNKDNTNFYVYDDGKRILIKRKDSTTDNYYSYRLYVKNDNGYSLEDDDATEYQKSHESEYSHEIK